MKVPFNDLKRVATLEAAPLQAAAARVINSGWFVMGPEVQHFEAEFAHATGGSHSCVSVANGSDALGIGLQALGIGPGDLVATAANAAMYSTLAILSLGAIPVFVDSNSEHTLSLEHFRMVSAAGTLKAVVVTHLYGRLADIEPIVALARTLDIAVLEDCAQAHFAKRGQRMAGTFGDVGTFSFYPTKNLGALGDAGALLCANSCLDQRARALRQYGWKTKYSVETAGGRNSRLDEMQAAFLRVRLPGLGASTQRRMEIAQRYSLGIHHPWVRTPKPAGDEFVAHLYVVASPKRYALKAYLAECGIGSEVHYPSPDHRQPIIAQRYADVFLPNTEQAAAEVLSLPCFPELSDAEVDYVIHSVNAWPHES